jgi:hypothetical protein
MKAQVQYNDFVGTAAADISDHSDLQKLLASRKVAVTRFEAVGASFYSGYNHNFIASIICLDRLNSTVNQPHLVDISFEVDFARDEFFNLFKRFKVIITNKARALEDFDISEEITLDDRLSPDEL